MNFVFNNEEIEELKKAVLRSLNLYQSNIMTYSFSSDDIKSSKSKYAKTKLPIIENIYKKLLNKE